MPTVVVANTKGGSGKTTTALVFAGEIVAAGGKVVILEGDPNRPMARWATRRGTPVIEANKTKVGSAADAEGEIRTIAGESRIVVITTDNDDEAVFDWIEGASAWSHFIVADPEGSPNQWLNSVASQADLVLIPFAPTTLDANQVARTIQVIRHIEKMARKTVLHRILVTKASPGAVVTRDEREIRENLAKNGLPLMTTTLHDRPAFRALFKFDALLSDLPVSQAPEHQVNGLAGARADAKALSEEILTLLTQAQEQAA
ncbi:division plane positioning ATPase MipZ [Caulobacter sp. 17J65-9]|uniref:nucleotide-binding protein n=1 Tax=Caulobacter sp. 17J65-9 TaxID=2709382 RepID=UPI0013CC2204|nr:division plane positioning ATPase MipZ [Caulobacter sp. 17J65-9]NEX91155.1 AAA family ATPase [Caulobacter sp. 17J65-9]